MEHLHFLTPGSVFFELAYALNVVTIFPKLPRFHRLFHFEHLLFQSRFNF